MLIGCNIQKRKIDFYFHSQLLINTCLSLFLLLSFSVCVCAGVEEKEEDDDKKEEEKEEQIFRFTREDLFFSIQHDNTF